MLPPVYLPLKTSYFNKENFCQASLAILGIVLVIIAKPHFSTTLNSIGFACGSFSLLVATAIFSVKMLRLKKTHAVSCISKHPNMELVISEFFDPESLWSYATTHKKAFCNNKLWRIRAAYEYQLKVNVLDAKINWRERRVSYLVNSRVTFIGLSSITMPSAELTPFIRSYPPDTLTSETHFLKNDIIVEAFRDKIRFGTTDSSRNRNNLRSFDLDMQLRTSIKRVTRHQNYLYCFGNQHTHVGNQGIIIILPIKTKTSVTEKELKGQIFVSSQKSEGLAFYLQHTLHRSIVKLNIYDYLNDQVIKTVIIPSNPSERDFDWELPGVLTPYDRFVLVGNILYGSYLDKVYQWIFSAR